MNRKIGVFLDVQPVSGGAFQFSLTVLYAFSALARERFATVAVYTDPAWKPHVNALKIDAVYVKKGLWGPLACRRISGWLPMRLWRSACQHFHPVSKILQRLACDLWIFPAQDTWTYLLPVPALGVIFDLMHRYERCFPEVSSWGIYQSRERHYNNMCRWARGLLVDSETGRRHVLESYEIEPARVHVLPFVAPAHSTCGSSRIGRHSRLPPKYIFYPSQFWDHKNHPRLIEAAGRLKAKLPDLNLVFVGSKKNGYPAAFDLVRRLGIEETVHFLGYVPDAEMAELYRKARAMIMPTFFGPTNIPPLEAIANGCPVAVSEIYGMPEQLGDAALYFNPASVEEISQVIERLWTDDDLCRELARRGLSRASKWTQAHFTQRLSEIISSLSQP
jgi:glycosyltransferase involved in cell wall biosynthesis